MRAALPLGVIVYWDSKRKRALHLWIYTKHSIVSVKGEAVVYLTLHVYFFNKWKGLYSQETNLNEELVKYS